MSVAAGLGAPGAAVTPGADEQRRMTRAVGRRPFTRAAVAEALAVAAILVLAVVPRLVGIANDTDLSDEGIRAVQLRLMAAGYWPVREIYAAQGPLSLPATYPLYALLGGDLVAARLAVTAYSLVGLLATYWLVRRLAGPVAGLAAGTLLAISPLYLEGSRLALVEVPSMVPALAALVALLCYREGGRRVWLVGSAILLAVAMLVKPMVLMAAAPAAMLLAWPILRPDSDSSAGRPWRRTFADTLLYGLTGLAVVVLTIVVIGPAETYAQLVEYRAGARAVLDSTTAENWARISGQLGREGPGLLIAAGVGATVLARRPLAVAVPLAWLAVGLALLLVYTPLYPKHVVYLVPPLAILAGATAGAAARALGMLAARRRPGVLGAASVLATLGLVATLSGVVEADRRILARQPSGDLARYADDLRVVAAATAPNDFIVMDDPYLAGLTGRLMPPHMADLSYTRILARTLASTRAKSETEDFDARVVVVQDDRLGQLGRYLDWVDRSYVLVKAYVRRAPNRYRRVYVHSDADLAAVRVALAPSIEQPFRAETGSVAVLGYTLDRRELRPREVLDLTVHWEAVRDTPPGHDVVIRLRDADGQPVQETELPIGDGEQVFGTWRAGRWQLQTLHVEIDRRVRPGRYTLTLGLDSSDPTARAIRGTAGAVEVNADGELVLGTIVVR